MSNGKSWKRELTEDAAIIVIVLVIIWGTGFGLQVYLGTPAPLLAVESGSMEPVLYRGDLVVVRAVEPTTLQVGDIIIYESTWTASDVPIVHRIVDIQDVGGELRFFTKGDNNSGLDPDYRTIDHIIAKVIGSIRYFGFVTLLLITYPIGIFSIILLILVFFITSVICENYGPRIIDEEPETSEGLG